jgi:hypothetical protein
MFNTDEWPSSHFVKVCFYEPPFEGLNCWPVLVAGAKSIVLDPGL